MQTRATMGFKALGARFSSVGGTIALLASSLAASCKDRPSIVPPNPWVDAALDTQLERTGAETANGEAPESGAQDVGDTTPTAVVEGKRAPRHPSDDGEREGSTRNGQERTFQFQVHPIQVGDEYQLTVSTKAVFDADSELQSGATRLTALRMAFSCAKTERLTEVSDDGFTSFELSFGECYEETEADGVSNRNLLPVSEKNYNVRRTGDTFEFQSSAGGFPPAGEREFLEKKYAPPRIGTGQDTILPRGAPPQQLRPEFGSEQLLEFFGTGITLNRVELRYVESSDCSGISCGRFDVDFEAARATEQGDALIVAGGDAFFSFDGIRLARLDVDGSIDLTPLLDGGSARSGSFELELTESATYAPAPAPQTGAKKGEPATNAGAAAPREGRVMSKLGFASHSAR